MSETPKAATEAPTASTKIESSGTDAMLTRIDPTPDQNGRSPSSYPSSWDYPRADPSIS